MSYMLSGSPIVFCHSITGPSALILNFTSQTPVVPSFNCVYCILLKHISHLKFLLVHLLYHHTIFFTHSLLPEEDSLISKPLPPLFKPAKSPSMLELIPATRQPPSGVATTPYASSKENHQQWFAR